MAAKIFDGFFLGDAETSMDGDFLDLNKISRLVNLAGMEVSNVWATQGFVYETYNWEDQPDYLVFPGMERDRALQDLIEFIDVSIRRGLSVLVFSLRGVSRNVFAVCAYLMYKYHWGFEKSYDFVLSKKSDIQINQGFVQQLFALEKRLHTQRQKLLQMTHPTLEQNDLEFIKKEQMRKKEWDPAYLQSNIYGLNSINKKGMSANNPVRIGTLDEMDEDEEGDELLLIYSFLNSKNTLTVMPGPYLEAIDIPKHFKLKFNNELQEEDIHMFPTQPSAPNLKAKFGILKKKKVPKVTVKKADAASEALMARPTSASVASIVQSTNATAQIPVSGPGSVKVSKGNENKINGTAPIPTTVQMKGKDSNKDIVLKENDNVNGTAPHLAPSKSKDSREVLKEISGSDKGLGSSKQPTQNQNLVQVPQSLATTASSSSASGSIRSTSSALAGRDLCQYVGVGVGVSGARAEGGNIEQGGPTPEERLRYLMQDMQVHGPGGVPRVDDNYDLKGRPGLSRSTKPTGPTAANTNTNTPTTNDHTIDRCTEKSSDKRWDKSDNKSSEKTSSKTTDRNSDKNIDTKITQKTKNSTSSDASAVLSRYKPDGLSERDDGGERKRKGKDTYTSTVPMNGMGESKGLYQDSNLSLSLYDLAALPLHSDRIASPKGSKTYNSSNINTDTHRHLSRSSSMGEDDDRESQRISRSKREMAVTAALSRGTVSSNGRYSVGIGAGSGSGSTFQMSDRERDRERERDHEFQRDRLRAIERENAKDRAREREREMEWEREREREKGREREREKDREADRAYKIQQHIINQQHRQSPQSVKKPTRKNLVPNEHERDRDRDREVDVLASFQQRGNEAAVRVSYSNMPISSSEPSLTLNLNTPNKNVRKAWQEDPYNYRTNGTHDLKGRNATNTAMNTTLNTTSTKPNLPVGQADRERDRERSSTQSVDSRMSIEREKVTPRTYRHGTPARLPTRSSTAPKALGSRETPTHPKQGSWTGPIGVGAGVGGGRTRAVSPSPIGSRTSREGLSNNNNNSTSAFRNQSPGTRGLVGRDFSNTTRTRGSYEVESLGDNMSTGYSLSDASHDSRMPARAYSASKLRGSTPVRYTRPQSPGTRKGVTPSMAHIYASSSTSSLPARCSTPTRGSWKF